MDKIVGEKLVIGPKLLIDYIRELQKRGVVDPEVVLVIEETALFWSTAAILGE